MRAEHRALAAGLDDTRHARGYWRQQVMERAWVEGRFVPFDGSAVLALAAAGIVLGFARLAAIVA